MIRTVDELMDKIAEDFNWRRKELSDLKALIETNDKKLRGRLLIRCAIAMLYAHWEGFIKKTSSYYLEYVASLRLPYKNLAPNFIALCIKSKFSELAVSEKISGGNLLAEFFCTHLDKPSNVPYKKGIDTKHNLSSIVLIDIISALGLNESAFATRWRFIDLKLVNPRNHIAHGENIELSISDYLELHDDVLGMLEIYQTEIINAVILRQFERRI